ILLITALAVVPISSRQAKPQPTPAVEKPWPDASGLAERKREADRRRLFRFSNRFNVTLTADFKAVMRDRNPDSTTTFPATISFPANDGTLTSLPIRLRSRGHSRRNAG